MADETIAEIAQASVEKTLTSGQSFTVDGMSKSRAALRDAHFVLTEEEKRTATRAGRRPLFRGLNLSGVE